MTQHDPFRSIDPRQADELAERLDIHGIPRRRFLQMVGGTIAAASAGSILAACGGGGSSSSTASSTGGSTVKAAATTDGKTAIINFALTGDYEKGLNEGAEAAAEQLGMPFASYDGKAESGTQQNEWNQALTQGTKSIFVSAADGGLVQTLAESANENKVYFADAWLTPPWYTPWDAGPYYTMYLEDDEVQAVAATAEELFKAMGEEGTVVRIGGGAGASVENKRLAGFKQALAKYPKVSFGGQLYGNFGEPQASQQAAASLLSKNPDTTGICCFNDDAATGAIAAIEAAGKTPGKDIFVIGTNGSIEGVNRVKSGTQLATTGNAPTYPSYVTMANFYDHLNGWKPNEAERLFGWKAVILTQKNIGPYMKRYVEGPASKQFSAKLLSRTLSPKDWDWQFEAFPWDDLDEFFAGEPKPSGYQYPAAYTKAKEDGSFEEVTKLWKQHYKIPVLGPGPFA